MDRVGASGGRMHSSLMKRAVTVVVLGAAVLSGISLWSSLSPPADPVGAPDALISVFTFVSTGIVYVEPETSEIVWQDAGRDEQTIGEIPWRNQGKARPGESTGFPAWRENRDLVGNPDHDLVTWVETEDGERGDLVVVRASTGEVLARTPVQAPEESFIVIASVDEDAVYFATPHPTTGFPDVPGAKIWVWRWTAGEQPENLESGRYYNDVSAGMWAVYGNGVEFEDEHGRTLVTVPFSDEKPTDFGGALSPDGRFWYGARTSQIVETATGTTIDIPAARERDYAWTGSKELTLTKPFLVCSAVTGQCQGPTTFVAQDVCAPYGIVCGDNLPVN